MTAPAIPSFRVAGPAPASEAAPRSVLRDRWWFLIVFLVALTIFCGTDTGRIFFDTKLGVDINAHEFLIRLWSLWNPLEWLGSLQDQYIGYALPIAPFFLVGQLLHIPVWLIERLWLSLLLAVGFSGMLRLARTLGIGSDNSRVLAAAVFALWPTFSILVGSTSAAALPGLVAPWAVLPLVAAVRGQLTPVRAAARSGVAIAAMGGVNAVCTLAVLVLPAVYILTHTRSRERARLFGYWAVAVVAATAWWAIPLLLQGHYAFNFLPYIEQSATTSRTMSAAAVLRGTGTWTAYFNLGGTPWLAAGWAMVTSPAAILASALVSATGLAGLARRDMPERRWLCTCAGLAAAVALAGYYGPLGGPFHSVVDGLLNGPLAPFRSLYKIEPVIAVALALGCAHALDRLWRLSIPMRRARLAASAATAPVVALALAGLAWPQLTGQSLQAGSFRAIPAYWNQTAAYLARNSPRETALVVPSNPHGQYTWGDSIDDPLEPLASSPWVERGLVPYGGAGSQDFLATAEQAVESGQEVPGLAAYLARAGIRYVVVRNDTATSVAGYTPPQVVNETLTLSGFHQVAAFGPRVPAAPGYPNLAGVAPGFATSYPAVQIFQADAAGLSPGSPVTIAPVSATALINGGPDSLLQLEAQGTLGSRPAVIDGQPMSGTPALWAVTDGQRRADTDFGTTTGFQSYTYTATQKNPVDDPLGGAGGPPRQLLPVAPAGHQTVAVLRGAASVTASSSGTWISEAPQYNPVNAFDGNPATAWAESDPYTPVGQWIQISFDKPIELSSTIGIQLLDDSVRRPVADELRVTTAAGSATTSTVTTPATQQLRVPAGRTRWLRITILGATNVIAGQAGAGISDVLIPGVQVTSYLQPAESVQTGIRAPAVAFSFAQQVASPYAQDSADSVTVSSRLFRTFVMPAASQLSASLTAVPAAGPALNALITSLSPAGRSYFSVTASSTWDGLPEFGPDSMYSQSAPLPWISGAGDAHPELHFSWRGRRTIRTIILRGANGIATAPTGVLVGGHRAFRLESVGLGGVVRISPPLRTSQLYLSFSALSSSAAGNTAAGQPGQLPVGLDQVLIPGLVGLSASVPNPAQPFHLACGQGPAIVINGQQYPTSVTGTLADLIGLRPVQLKLCTPGGTLTLAAGRQWLTTSSSADFTVTGLSLTTSPAPVYAKGSRSVRILTWGADARTLRIGPGATSYVEIHEDSSPGWRATLDGRPLQPATLDGWQQAFIVPAGQGGTITLTFRPATAYHAGLIVSGLLLLALAVFAFGTGSLRRRRRHGAHGAPRRRGPADSRFRAPGRPGLLFATVSEPATPVMPSAPTRRSGLSPAALALLSTTAVIAMAGGPVAIAVPALAIIGRWRARWLPLIAAGAMILTGVLVATSRVHTALGTGPFGAAAQACALIALSAALVPGRRNQ